MESITCMIVKNLLNSNSDTTSSEDSESLDYLLSSPTVSQVKHAKVKEYVTHIVDRYSDIDFKSHFRLNRAMVEELLLHLQCNTVVVRGRPQLPIKQCLLLSIWVMSNQEPFRAVADRFGVSRGHAHTVFIKICKMLTYKQQHYIVWPKGALAVKAVEEFNVLRGPNSFPNVFGCVDGTHIPIPGPISDNSYYNRKGYHSVLLQGICNAKQEFINVYCGWPGSTHDARVWQNSEVYSKLNARETLIPPNSYLLGDSAYPLRKFLIVPFRDNGHLTHRQKKFNQKLSSTRVVIEQTFGRLKGLFRRLKYLNILNISYAKYIIVAACVLHNVCLKDGEPYEEYEHIDELHQMQCLEMN